MPKIQMRHFDLFSNNVEKGDMHDLGRKSFPTTIKNLNKKQKIRELKSAKLQKLEGNFIFEEP